ncbi:isocitrate/isopropylmalate dehydrogenase family protein [Roseibium aggregatum]|uniref:isocitrate/isopropylmalate dehydrogenase family protein n=1 Tax=Roseibium aggregatum TaxID=187304 RepID=UPI001F35A299|nr:isocitrate/isopropylmalate dehydrogenase family protein [Roseibium aggregatum]
MTNQTSQQTNLTLAVLAGDGIGPEITTATQAVLSAAAGMFGFGISYRALPAGFAALETHGTTFPQDTLAKASEADGILMGPVSHNEYPPRDQGGINPSGALRIGLDLYANIRPAYLRPGLKSPLDKSLDLVIVRENTEGFYSDRSMYLGPGEFMPTPDIALSVRKVTREASLRIAETAFALARKRRKKVTAVHKANVLRVSDGLFLECVRTVAKGFPDVAYEERLVDAMAAYLVRDPAEFDVIVTTNMFGDILSDQASEMAGGLGLAASLNAGADHAMAQAQHGSAPDIAGRDIANPVSLIASGAMLLNWIGRREGDKRLIAASDAIEKAVDILLEKPETRTRDLGGPLGTRAFSQKLAEALQT